VGDPLAALRRAAATLGLPESLPAHDRPAWLEAAVAAWARVWPLPAVASSPTFFTISKDPTP